MDSTGSVCGTTVTVSYLDACGRLVSGEWRSVALLDGNLVCLADHTNLPFPGDVVLASYRWGDVDVPVNTVVADVYPGALHLRWPDREEQRRFARVEALTPAVFADPGGGENHGTLTNVSLQGAKLQVSNMVIAGTVGLVAFSLPSGPVSAVVQVLECLSGMEPELRVAFSVIGAQSQARIAQYIATRTVFLLAV